MNNLTSYLSIILLFVGCVLYPIWWSQGYLDTLYLKIAVAVACYGGLTANVIYLIKNNRRR